jgi:hypothetical protein
MSWVFAIMPPESIIDEKKGGKMFTLTYTNMAKFKSCPFKFKTSIIDGLRLISVSPQLRVGSAFHIYREAGLAAMEEYFKQFHPSSQEEADNLEIQKTIVRSMVSIAPEDAEVEREVEWLNPLINPATGAPSRTFVLGGKADGVLDGSILIEEKTRGGGIGKSDIDKLSIDTQILNAIVNLEASGGYSIKEVWYRYYRRPSIRQRQGESVPQYCERVVEDYKQRPEFYFHEERLMFPRNQLEAFRYDLWQVAKAILWMRNYDLWYRNTSYCAEWGGCQFLPLCRGDDIEGLYKVGTPNQELTKEEAHEELIAGIEI